MPKICKTFKIPMYQCHVQIILAENVLQTVNNIYKKNNSDIAQEGESYGSFFTFDIDKYFIVLCKYPTHGTIAHEIYHLVQRLMIDRDIEGEEVAAWITGYITDEIYNFLEIKKIKIGTTGTK